MSDIQILQQRVEQLEAQYLENIIELGHLDLLKTKTSFNENNVNIVVNQLNPYESAIFQPDVPTANISFGNITGIKKGDFILRIRGGLFIKVDGASVQKLFPVFDNTNNTITWSTTDGGDNELNPNPVVGGAGAQVIKVNRAAANPTALNYSPIVKFYDANNREIILYETNTFSITGTGPYTVAFTWANIPAVVTYAVIR